MAATQFQAKPTIGKLIQLAYSEDEDLTVKIVASKGRFTLVVDQQGNAKLIGTGGLDRFSGDPGLNRLLKKFLVDARQGGNGRKSAVYWRVHEHFEPISNAAWRRQRVFQQPVKGLGFKIKRVSIDFTPSDGRSFNYTATFRFAAGTSISVSGNFDVFEAIKGCSGLACNAARLLDGRNAEIEQKIQRAFH